MTNAREYKWTEGLAICLGMIGVQLATQVIAQWGPYFYSPSQGIGRTVYVNIALVGVLFFIGTVWDAITDPLVGIWSDRTRTRPGRLRLLPIRGRRRPFIFWGSIGLVVTSIAFWYPPIDATSKLNFAYGAVLLCLHWGVFTITVVPLTSLGPEIARSESARVNLGVWTAVGMICGLAMAIVLPGILIVQFDPARVDDSVTLAFRGTHGTSEEGIHEALEVLLPGGERPAPAMGPDGEDARVVFRGGLLDALDSGHVESAIRELFPDDVASHIHIEAIPGGRVATAPPSTLPPDIVSHLAGRISAALARDLYSRVVQEKTDGGIGLTYVGGLLDKLDARDVAETIQAAFPEDVRDQVQVHHVDAVLTVHLGERVLGPMSTERAVETVAEAVAGSACSAQFRATHKNQTVRAVFGKDLLAELNMAAVKHLLDER
ncbi:MAG TPA: hypothetical protein ENN80_03225, partial [Candidatus Hydrogenedentes bacterium]|nr:hypothetical protein [Candidatus Hydrogenedentota bacterium]